MLPSERRRLEETAAREAAGETLWATEFDRRTLVRLAEICVTLVRISRAEERDVSENLGFILRRSVGWSLTNVNLAALPKLAESTDLVLDILAAMPEALTMASVNPSLIEKYPIAVNNVLNEHRIAYKFVDGELISFESDELLQAVVEPALRLMTDSRFQSAHDAYLNALKEISNGDAGDAITDAGTALQEALTALGCEGKVLGALISDAKTKGLFKSHDTQLHEAMILATKWAASERNKNSDAHKHPDASLADAWFMVHVVGAIIVRLADPVMRGEPSA